MGRLNMNFYIEQLRMRYAVSSREEKSKILDEFCATSGQHRKHAIRALNKPSAQKYRKKKPGRKKEFKEEVILPVVKKIWLASNQLCSRRLKEVLPLWLPFYQTRYGSFSDDLRDQLLKISHASLDRLLQPLRVQHAKQFGGTKPGSLLRKNIPIKTNQWDEERPGFVEGDTVAHCGTSMLGNFIWSITVTDICSGWTENAATWNKGAHGVKEQVQNIEERLPFSILGWDSDNGSEFLNHHLVNYFQNRSFPIPMTRSRPYHSGDNAHVEQKNWTHVRQLFGYDRFEDSRLVALMNDLYANEWSLLHNYFCPSVKIQEKVRIQSKIKKKHDQPQTPYQRLMKSVHLSLEKKAQLKQTFDSLNPFQLKEDIEKKLKIIFYYARIKMKRKTGTIDK